MTTPDQPDFKGQRDSLHETIGKTLDRLGVTDGMARSIELTRLFCILQIETFQALIQATSSQQVRLALTEPQRARGRQDIIDVLSDAAYLIDMALDDWDKLYPVIDEEIDEVRQDMLQRRPFSELQKQYRDKQITAPEFLAEALRLKLKMAEAGS